MYIIKITEDSYKVILSKDDINKYGKSIFEGKDNSKRFFSDIMSKVDSPRKNSSIVHAEFFEDKFGGGELFICIGKNISENCRHLFSSKSIEDIIGVCKVLSKNNYHLSSRLFIFEGVYFLLLFLKKEIPLMPSILKEFGNSGKASKLIIWQLEEHGKVLISGNAVETICSAFT